MYHNCIITLKKMDFKKSLQKLSVAFSLLFLALLVGATFFSSNFITNNQIPNTLKQLLTAQETTPLLYVSTTGSDTIGTGTVDKPFATINKAQSYVVPGTIVYVHGGIYNQQVNITKGSGTADAYVTYTSYPGERAVIDGTGVGGTSPSNDFKLIQISKISYINFSGFEVKNSLGRGINTTDVNHVNIKNNKVHDIKYKAISISGTNINVEGNEIYNAAMINENQVLGNSSWPQAIGTWKKSDGSASQNVNFINNTVYNSWGEGIDLIALDGGVVSSNRIYDTFSVLLYLDNARNITIDKNYLSATNPAYYRKVDGTKPEGTDNPKYPARGIMISSESCCRPTNYYNSENITISNNLVVNTKSNLRYWLGSYNTPYNNLKVYYNIFKDTVKDPAVHFDSVTTSGNEIKNNIIYGNVVLPNASNWTFSNNNWPNGKPSIDNSSTSFSADPLFVNPISNGPADGFRLQPNSSSIGKGIPLSITTDYFNSTRGNISTTVGFYEHNSSGGNEPTSTPTPTPDSYTTPSPSPAPTKTPTPSPTRTPTPQPPTNAPTPTYTPSPTKTPTPTQIPVSSTITVFAAGTPACGRYPNMTLNINGIDVMIAYGVTGDPLSNTPIFKTYQYTSSAKILPSQVMVKFTNDNKKAEKCTDDRNLRVNRINIDGVDYMTNNPSVFGEGIYYRNKCREGFFRTDWLYCNGYFQYK